MEAREVFGQLRDGAMNAYDAFVAQLAVVGTATYLPQNDDELWEYILSEYGFAIPREAICHDHVSPFQAIADVYFSRILDTVLIGPRGGGKTLALAIIDHLLVAHFGIEIANVGAIEEQAKKCYSYFEKFCLLPQFRNALVKPPMLSKTYLKNGGFLEIMPGTMNRVNSPHPNRAHLDEIELMDPKIIEEAKCLAGETLVQTKRGQKPIREVRAGDEVQAFTGASYEWREVAQVWESGVRATVTVALSSGRRITCTPDHKILTHNGWVEAQALREGDRLVPGVQNCDVRKENALLQKASAAPLAAREQREAGAQQVCMRWQKNASRDALPGLLFQGRTHLDETTTLAGAPVRLWWQEVAVCENVSPVSLQQSSRSGTSSGARINPGALGTCADPNQRGSEPRGGEGDATARGNGNPLQASSCGRKIHSRLQVRQCRGRGFRRPAQVFPGNNRARHPKNKALERAWVHRGCTERPRATLLVSDISRSVFVASIATGPSTRVYDITIPGLHNFVAEGVVVHNSMPQRQKGRAPATIWTSSRKKAFGPMEDLLLKATETGMPVYKYCAFEIIENCPPTRHLEGEGCKTCPLHDICKEKTRDEHGKEVFKEGPGRASRAHGWLSIDDLIQKYMSMERSVFKAQWLSEKPETFGLAFPMFERSRHVIRYKYDPVYPVVAGLDFGFTNPSVALYMQVLPSDILVVFAEDYRPSRTAEMMAESMKEEPWFGVTRWRVADSAGRGDRETLIRHGVSNEASRKEGTVEDKSSRVTSVNIIRYLLDPIGREPLLYISTDCKNLIRELERYHHPDQRLNQNIDEIPAKIDDHAVDALRYIVMRMYRGVIVV